MKYLRKYNESVMSYPIDPEADVNAFVCKFKNKMDKNREGWAISKSIDQIIDAHPTMTDEWDWYEVYDTDDNGKKVKSFGIIEAVSEYHARLKMATILGNMEIVYVGYYRAKKIDDINLHVKKLEFEIKTKEESLDKLKDALNKIKGSK